MSTGTRTLVVLAAAPRLRRAGVPGPACEDELQASHELYRSLARRLGPAAHSRHHAMLRAFGRVASRPARVYLVGGALAVIEGWRETTVDIDLRLEPDALREAVASLTDR